MFLGCLHALNRYSHALVVTSVTDTPLTDSWLVFVFTVYTRKSQFDSVSLIDDSLLLATTAAATPPQQSIDIKIIFSASCGILLSPMQSIDYKVSTLRAWYFSQLNSGVKWCTSLGAAHHYKQHTAQHHHQTLTGHWVCVWVTIKELADKLSLSVDGVGVIHYANMAIWRMSTVKPFGTGPDWQT